jgi:hypothetical protein
LTVRNNLLPETTSESTNLEWSERMSDEIRYR